MHIKVVKTLLSGLGGATALVLELGRPPANEIVTAVLAAMAPRAEFHADKPARWGVVIMRRPGAQIKSVAARAFGIEDVVQVPNRGCESLVTILAPDLKETSEPPDVLPKPLRHRCPHIT